jgi:hypothetical protein
MIGLAVRLGSVRPLLAACLTVLLLVTSFAPCCAFAKPTDGAHVSAPADPCERKTAPVATPCPCTQLSCQAFNNPAATALITPGWSMPLVFVAQGGVAADYDERPDHPPPRTLL